MKLLIDGKYKEVGFWSFVKCTFLSQLGVMALVYGTVFVVIMLITILEALF